MVWAKAQVVYGKRNWFPERITGTTPAYLAIRDWEDLDEGECFNERDVRTSNAVCLIGATVKRELFEDESPIGKKIRIRNVPFRVIGVLGRQRRRHDGPGPGRRDHRPLDDGQVPRQRQQRRRGVQPRRATAARSTPRTISIPHPRHSIPNRRPPNWSTGRSRCA